MKKIVGVLAITIFFGCVGYFLPKVLLSRDVQGNGVEVNITKYQTAVKEIESNTNANLKNFARNSIITPSNVFDKTIIGTIKADDKEVKDIDSEKDKTKQVYR